jgi:hypothetical protein
MVVLVTVLLAALHAHGFPTPHPRPTATDFSGRWTIDAANASAPGSRPAARGDMGSGWGSPITIAQEAGKLTVTYVFFGRGDLQPPLKFVYALDGSETRNSVMMGRGTQEQRSKTRWDGDALVITTLYDFIDPSTQKTMTAEVRQTLSLDSSGAALTVETFRAGVLGGPSATTTTVYRKTQG